MQAEKGSFMREAPNPQVAAAFRALLANQDANENDLQRFLEKHTAFIETPGLLNHRLNLNSVIAKLPIGPWKTDFAYLTKSTVAWRLVMVELEHPGKQLFQAKGRHSAFHADLNNAIAQIDAWRDRWATHQAEILDQLAPVMVPSAMRRNALTPFYVLVIGRDHEFRNIDARKRRLAAVLNEKNLYILTYDTLIRTYEEGRGYGKCVLSPTATGFRIKHVDGEPGSMFAYMEPQHLEVPEDAEAQLVSWQYDIPSWRAGEPLVFNQKWTMRSEKELDKVDLLLGINLPDSNR
jgi:hypothetical protein